MRRAAPAIALFFLSPLVAEFLLGDFTILQLPFLLLLAPAYGGAAVLIREVTRRAGRGWPTMILLASAYALIEEGLETQSLFNPGYLNAHLLDSGFIHALGIGLPWTLYVLPLHVVWSMSVPIALVEEWSGRRTEPWLRRPGLIVFGALALIGALGSFGASYGDGHFMAHPAQLLTVAVLATALVVTALRLTRERRPLTGRAPAARVVLLVTLAGGALFESATWTDNVPLTVAVLLASFAGVALPLLTWSRRQGWTARHRLAAAGGGLLTYAWHSFASHPVVHVPAVVEPLSHAFFALLAVALLLAELRRLRTRPTPRPALA